MTDQDPWARIEEAKKSVEERITIEGQVGIVLGSGLGPLANSITDRVTIPYNEIEGMPVPRVHGHQGQLLVGKLGKKPVACLSGRAHLYEGHPPDTVVFGVRLLAALGMKTVILSNAAGGITDNLAPGTLMIIEDHLNLTGQSPLVGPNDESRGPRFPDMSHAYSPQLRQLAHRIADQQGTKITQGVYAGLLGPTYETPAEVRMLETLGANAVGMSTVLETIALRHQGVSVLGISCITNQAAGKTKHKLSHDEVAEVAGAASAAFVELVTKIVAELP